MDSCLCEMHNLQIANARDKERRSLQRTREGVGSTPNSPCDLTSRRGPDSMTPLSNSVQRAPFGSRTEEHQPSIPPIHVRSGTQAALVMRQTSAPARVISGNMIAAGPSNDSTLLCVYSIVCCTVTRNQSCIRGRPSRAILQDRKLNFTSHSILRTLHTKPRFVLWQHSLTK